MENERKPIIRLGVFVALGISVLLVGMALIGRKRHLFSDTFTLYAMFHDVGGLQVGNQVRYAGVNVGTVEGLDFLDARTIRVTLIVEKKIQKFLTTSAVGTVSSEGVIGNKILVLAEPETGGRPLVDQDSIQAYPPPNLDALFAEVKSSVDDFHKITRDMAVIMHKVRRGEGTVGKVFMDPTFARTMDHTVVNLQDGAQGFKEIMDAAKHSWVLWGFGKDKEKKQEEGKAALVEAPPR